MRYTDDILITLFGGGYADYRMLDKCQYDFEEVLQYITSRKDLNDMEFHDILIGIFDMYFTNLESAIKNKKEKITKNIEYLEQALDYCGYGKKELMELEHEKEKLSKLECLCPFNDIEYHLNYLCTRIRFVDDDIKEVYKELLSEEVEKEPYSGRFCGNIFN